MANVLHKTHDPADYRTSVHSPDYPEANWFHSPDISAVVNIPTKYWVVGTNPVQEMTAQQKAAVDAADAAAALASAKSSADAAIDGLDGYELRAIAKLLIDEINILRQRDAAVRAAVAAATTLANLKTGFAALPALNDRTLSQAKTAYKALIAGSDLDE